MTVPWNSKQEAKEFLTEMAQKVLKGVPFKASEFRITRAKMQKYWNQLRKYYEGGRSVMNFIFTWLTDFLIKILLWVPDMTGVPRENKPMKLTMRQGKLYEYFQLHAGEDGRVGRTSADAARDLKMQPSAISLILDELVEKGLVEKKGEGKYKRELWLTDMWTVND